jgi:hypothetical protein
MIKTCKKPIWKTWNWLSGPFFPDTVGDAFDLKLKSGKLMNLSRVESNIFRLLLDQPKTTILTNNSFMNNFLASFWNYSKKLLKYENIDWNNFLQTVQKNVIDYTDKDLIKHFGSIKVNGKSYRLQNFSVPQASLNKDGSINFPIVFNDLTQNIDDNCSNWMFKWINSKTKKEEFIFFDLTNPIDDDDDNNDITDDDDGKEEQLEQTPITDDEEEEDDGKEEQLEQTPITDDEEEEDDQPSLSDSEAEPSEKSNFDISSHDMSSDAEEDDTVDENDDDDGDDDGEGGGGGRRVIGMRIDDDDDNDNTKKKPSITENIEFEKLSKREKLLPLSYIVYSSDDQLEFLKEAVNSNFKHVENLDKVFDKNLRQFILRMKRENTVNQQCQEAFVSYAAQRNLPL